MRRKLKTIIVCVLLSCNALYAQVGVITNNPDKSAVLDMTGSNDKGLLIPNVSLIALNNPAPIVNNAPATGLMVYNSNASLPPLNGQPGGKGFYYWDSVKWCHMLVPADIVPDNLGNHTATDTLTMSNYDVNNVNKLSTKTESIAKGTDGLLPQVNNVAMSADTAGNVVWRVPPGTIATDSFSFYKESTGNVLSTYQTWVDVPGLSNFTYTAPATGTLVIKGVVYARMDPGYDSFPIPNQFYQSVYMGVRIQVYNGPALVDQNCSILACKALGSAATSGFPERGIILLQTPVTKGVTYTFTTMYDSYAYDYNVFSFTNNSFMPPPPRLQSGTIVLNGGSAVATSTINAFLVTAN
ncbi:MAG: hypothetical protein J0I41_10530 [Filimonas sp.]|nr:hypothetical protein [Filimonas sp.]